MSKFRSLAVAVVFGVGALWGGPAVAQDESRAALAREMVTLMGVEDTLSDLLTNMSPMVAQAMSQEMHLTPSQTARLGELLIEEFRTETPSMMSQLTQVYASDLSEQQLREIVAFLNSPSGRAMVAKQEAAKEQLGRIGQVAGMSAALRALTRLNQEMRQQSH